MKNKIKVLLSVICISASTFSFASSLGSSCNAVIQNNSNESWNIKFIIARGNVGLSDQYCDSNSCILPPHSSANMEYNYNSGFALGLIHLFDHKGNDREFTYGSPGLNTCPKLTRIGGSDAVMINEPKSGSLLIANDSW
jgi:hypothetical protein